MKSLTNSSVDQETQQTDTPETPGAPGASSIVEDPEGSVDDDSTPPGIVVAPPGTVDAGDSPRPGAKDPADEATEGRVEDLDGEETCGEEGSNATLGGAAAEAGGGASAGGASPGVSGGVTWGDPPQDAATTKNATATADARNPVTVLITLLSPMFQNRAFDGTPATGGQCSSHQTI